MLPLPRMHSSRALACEGWLRRLVVLSTPSMKYRRFTAGLKLPPPNTLPTMFVGLLSKSHMRGMWCLMIPLKSLEACPVCEGSSCPAVPCKPR